ncbi:MAG: TIGR00269 family protein [Methanobacterium sp.]|uniref:TIGR00269 family protein n=1 Tax=Methanobacterium sp. TaxID=2164 RepID=UPI003D649C78|nr:TIGR00269 family protein [Methanobacterium sp.]
MKTCTKCGAKPVIIHRKASGQMLCKECFIESTTDKVLKSIRKNKLIEKGDKVAVALSGGKDSVMLLDILNSLYKRNIIDIVAITIDEGIEGYRKHGVEIAARNAKKLGVDHKIVPIKDYFGKNLDEIMLDDAREHGACTYCGVFRRWIINKIAREEGATKIATGHNLDDETQAILMNYLEGNIDNLTRIGMKSEPKSDKFTVKIKPLREIPEKEIGLYVVARELDVHFDECPYSKESFRGEVGRFIKELSVDHPTIMYSTLRGFDKIKPVLKKEFSGKKVDMGQCIRCGEPSSHELCRACLFYKKINNEE